MRRALTFLVVAIATAAASSSWLYDGDLAAAISPVVPKSLAQWDADGLAKKEGIVPASAPLPSPPDAPAPADDGR
jgi:hypothetical protein